MSGHQESGDWKTDTVKTSEKVILYLNQTHYLLTAFAQMVGKWCHFFVS